MKIKNFIAIGLLSLGVVACSSDKPPVSTPVATVNETYYFNSIWFANNSSTVAARFDNIIQLNANYLVTHPEAKVQIEGNASDIGNKSKNQQLGLARAKAVMNKLIQFGTKPEQIQIVSFGQTKPIFKELAKNRRADVIYINSAPHSYFIDQVPIVATADEIVTVDSQNQLPQVKNNALNNNNVNNNVNTNVTQELPIVNNE